MVFTNNPATTIMSETFFLKDSTARGLQRYFSIILGNREKGFILRSFTDIQQETLLNNTILINLFPISRESMRNMNVLFSRCSNNNNGLESSRNNKNPVC